MIFEELAKYRQLLGLPSVGSEGDRATIAKLEIGDCVFFGISAGSNPNRRKITLKVNPISRTHAEAKEELLLRSPTSLRSRGSKSAVPLPN